MKRNALPATLTILFCTMLIVGIAPALLADGDHVCSYRSVAGKWGYTYSGTDLPSDLVLGIGTFTLDKNGNLSDGKLTGDTGTSTFSGTFTVNPDCTGSTTVDVCDQDGNCGTFSFYIVWTGNSNAVRMNSLEPGLVTALHGEKLFPSRD